MSWCLQLPSWSAIAGQWLYDWQTIISGLLALFAALLAGWLLSRQIKQTETFNQNQIQRQHNAARVVLPLVLSTIYGKCTGVATAVAEEIEYRWDNGDALSMGDIHEGRDRQKNLPPIDLPADTLVAIKQFVETLQRRPQIKHFAELVSSVQILLSRNNDFNLGQVAALHGLYGLLIDAGKVRMLVDAIFNYARFVDEGEFELVGTVGPDEIWDKILASAIGLVFLRPRIDQYSQELAAIIARYKAIETTPWNEAFGY